MAEDRRKLLAFARDLLNSDYAGHRLTFELFAQSPPFAHLAAVYSNFDWAGPLRLRRSARPACPSASSTGRVPDVPMHTRIRPFNTKDTYPEQKLDNDLCQAVGRGRHDLPARPGRAGSRHPRERRRRRSRRPGRAGDGQRRAAAGECGAALEDICKFTIYVTDIRYREPVYRVLGEWLKGVFPVFTGLVVVALARPEWVVEIDVTAVRS